jgi:hypothetical protein
MNDIIGTERLLAAWMEAEAPPRAPAGLRDDILSATTGIRPRPAWLARLKGNHMNVIMGGRVGRSPYQRYVPILVALGLLLALLVGAAVVGSRLLLQSDTSPGIARVAFTEPLFQVVQGDDGTTWVSTFNEEAGAFQVTGIHRVNPDGTSAAPVVTDLPPGHVSFVVLDGVIWASHDEAGGWRTWDAETGEPIAAGELGGANLRPLEPLMAYGAVWQPLFGSDGVARLDPRTGETVRITTAPAPRGLAAGADHVWVAHVSGPVVGIDPETNEVTTTLPVESTSCGASVAGGRVWVFACSGSITVDVFEPDGTLAKTYRSDAVPIYAFDYDGDVWTVETTAEARVFENDQFKTVPSRTRIVRLDRSTLEPLASYDAGEGITIPDRADLVTGTLDSDALWLVQGTDAIRVPLSALPDRPGE